MLPSLQENASLAVTECLHAGIPFVAAATGGTPELVAPTDRDRALVPPDHIALGDRIAELAGAPLRPVARTLGLPPRHRYLDALARADGTLRRVGGTFRHAHARCGDPRPRWSRSASCIMSGPALVRMAIESVLAQDYPAIEAVLVDDGSESAAALNHARHR